MPMRTTHTTCPRVQTRDAHSGDKTPKRATGVTDARGPADQSVRSARPLDTLGQITDDAPVMHSSEAVVDLLRFGWLVLAGMMGASRVAFQLAGPVRMRAFLDGWKESRTRRLWGAVLASYALVVLRSAATSMRRLTGADRLLLALFLIVALGDSLLNLLPGSFSRFKEELQNQWVRRQPDPGRHTDRALFGTVNLLLGLASAAMAGLVACYRPQATRLLVPASATACLLTAALIAGARLEARGGWAWRSSDA
jgi:hypothetical protein